MAKFENKGFVPCFGRVSCSILQNHVWELTEMNYNERSRYVFLALPMQLVQIMFWFNAASWDRRHFILSSLSFSSMPPLLINNEEEKTSYSRLLCRTFCLVNTNINTSRYFVILKIINYPERPTIIHAAICHSVWFLFCITS